MSSHYRISIRRKLRLVTLTTCLAALSVTAVALLIPHFYFFKRDYQRDLRGIADIIGGALLTAPPGPAGAILATLRSRHQVAWAFVQLEADGSTAGQFGPADPTIAKIVRGEGFHDYAGQLLYIHPLARGDVRLGSLYLGSDYYRESLRQHWAYAGTLLAVLAGSLLTAMLAATQLERFIADPIHHLADTARRIAARSDYSLRATRSADDEVGEFTDSFNLMLDKIQNRDSALRYEIAERARAEQDLQRAHQQFMDASRQEGMADVATCVLHNVGNVLNSVNVSATLIAESLSVARTENLVRAAQLLRDQEGATLEAFLRDDPKGQVLPAYLSEASEQIAQERRTAHQELALLQKNIDHIKEIVAMQQSYARGFGLVRQLAVSDLIEDALRMNSSALERHGVSVVRDFQPVPDILVDQHKALQIVVNLLRNSRHALDDAAPQKKRLTVTVRPKSEGFIEIIVDDNGIGITEKNLARLFSHGFTTRTDGHGFGLHNGALTAKQMGGSLEGASDGHLRGATFTLTLPLKAPPSTT